MITALKRARCRIPSGEPDENGSNWPKVPLLPDIAIAHCSWIALGDEGNAALPRTEVRALAGEKELFVRFDCFINDPSLLKPESNVEPLDKLEHVWLEVFPYNDSFEQIGFHVDFKGMKEIRRYRLMPGERSLDTVYTVYPRDSRDVWRTSPKPENMGKGWHVYFDFQRDGWWAEMVIPWKSLGLSKRPATVGILYGRNVASGNQFPRTFYPHWPAVRPKTEISPLLESPEALIGDHAGAPEGLEIEEPCFGKNTGRLILGNNWPTRPGLIRVRTESGAGNMMASSEASIPSDAAEVSFDYTLARAYSSHLNVHTPPRLFIEVWDQPAKNLLYTTSLPMDKHIGICVNEPYGKSDGTTTVVSGTQREKWLDRIIRKLPRIERRTTLNGAPSDFCLYAVDRKAGSGYLAANLMRNDAWQHLAALIEKLFSGTEERLVAAMTFVAQKTVTNLVCETWFFDLNGTSIARPAHELMGPLSLLRYGGGPAVARAAVLARLLQHMTDPSTGKPFQTRVLALDTITTADNLSGRRTLDAFMRPSGRVGAVAVDHGDGQTLLDPTGLVFFVKDDDTLAPLEDILADDELRKNGAGLLAPVYAKLDIEEVLRQPVNRLLSRGVFPELCPNEEGHLVSNGLRTIQTPRIIMAKRDGESLPSEGFVDEWNNPGIRNGSVTVGYNHSALNVRVKVVGGPSWDSLNDRDKAMERVHCLIDTQHDSRTFFRFQAAATGERGSWRESSGGLQILYKHLSSDNWIREADVPISTWRAEVMPTADGAEIVFDLPFSVLEIETLPPVIGLNIWIEGRTPHYEQLFLARPLYRLPAHAFSFADMYLTDTPVTLSEIDYNVITWQYNTGRATLVNASAADIRVTLRATNSLTVIRRVKRSDPVSITVPANGKITTEFPFFVDKEEKYGAQKVILVGTRGHAEFFRSSISLNYACQPGVYLRFGDTIGKCANPKPGIEDFIDRKIAYICSRLPDLERHTTLDGATSDFVLRDPKGNIEFNLMKAGVLDEMARCIEGLFDNDVDRVLGIFFLSCHPSVAQHHSAAQTFDSGCSPLAMMRFMHGGGGGCCAFHNFVFAGMASHLKIGDKRLAAHTTAVYGHTAGMIGWRNSKVHFDADFGHFMLTPDGKDFPTLEKFRMDPSVLSNALGGEIARYFASSDSALLARKSVAGQIESMGTFPPGAPRD